MTPALWIARPTLVLASLCLILVPARARAVQGINLRWTQCLGDGGDPNRAFACNTNTGGWGMHGSFELGSDMPQVIGTEIYMKLAADGASLPAWWQFANGTCRQSALSMVFLVPASDVACVDWASGQSQGGIGAYCTVTSLSCGSPPAGANVAFIKAVHAVRSELATDLTGGIEYYDFTLNISNAKTVGAGSCAGCSTPVCIVLNGIRVVDSGDLHSRFLNTPASPGSEYVTWQGGGSPEVGGVIGCPAATPTRRSTWGAVKTLYR